MFSRTARPHSPSKSFDSATVFIVDSDASLRERLELLMRSAGWQTSSASSAEEFLALSRAMTPGCLLAETDLPGLSGLELQRRVIDRIEMPIVFLSNHADVLTTVQAMKAGAFEVLTKPFVNTVLLQAIQHAVELSRAALRGLARTRALQERYESLSRREREVMRLVVSGRLNKQVGGELGISEITVKAHRGKVMRKMQAASFAELVKMAASIRDDALGDQPALDTPYDFAYTRRSASEPFDLSDATRDVLAPPARTFVPLRSTNVSTETFV